MRFTCFMTAVVSFVLNQQNALAIQLENTTELDQFNDQMAQTDAQNWDMPIALAQVATHGAEKAAEAKAGAKVEAKAGAKADAAAEAKTVKVAVKSQSFNASDFIKHGKDVLEKVDHHHINCVLKSSQLKPTDSHDELKAKHDAIKALASKLKQRAENEKKDLDATKETEAELRRLLSEQKKTLLDSNILEKAKEAQEAKDMELAMTVRMREVEKLERVRLESMMKCEKERATNDMDEMRKHFEAMNKKKLDDAKLQQQKCAEAGKKQEGDSAAGMEAAKAALAKAQADFKKYENGTANPADKPASACQTETDAHDAEIEAKKKELDELIARAKKHVNESEDRNQSEKVKVAKEDAVKAVKASTPATIVAPAAIVAPATPAVPAKEGAKKAEAKPKVKTGEAKENADKITDDLEAEIKENIDDAPSTLIVKLGKILKTANINPSNASEDKLEMGVANMVSVAKKAKKDGKRIRQSEEFEKSADAVEKTLTEILVSK